MYVCMYVCMYVFIYVHMYVCMYVYMYICTYVCMYLNVESTWSLFYPLVVESLHYGQLPVLKYSTILQGRLLSQINLPSARL